MDYASDPLARLRALDILRCLRPQAFAGLGKLRIGRAFDGGYVMVDDLAGIAAAYSLGINDDVSWDLDVAGRGIEVFQYDHTITALPLAHPRFHWRRVGLAAAAAASPDMRPLAALIEENGHDGRGDLILKCDIEGAEWAVLAEAGADVLRGFRQIVVELHGLGAIGAEPFAQTARRTVAALTAHHRVVHVHGNNHRPWAVVGGIPLPSVIEVTLLRVDGRAHAPSGELFPTSLDFPCDPSRADLALGGFVFL